MLRLHYWANLNVIFYIFYMFCISCAFFTAHILHFAVSTSCTCSYNTNKRMKHAKKRYKKDVYEDI